MSFFKIYKARKYGYRSIYYDPKKEAREEREKRKTEGNEYPENEFIISIRRGSFRQGMERNKTGRHYQAQQANIRFIIILFLLLALLYYFLK